LRFFLCGLIFVFCLLGCGPPPNQDCPPNFFQNLTSYTVNPTYVTKSGISVDSSYPIDLDDLDRRLGLIRACIRAKMAQELDPSWQCLGYRAIPPLSCLTIKVVEPYPSCSEWQLLPVPAPDQLCIDKGLTPTPECKCMWRNLVQDDWVIITPPALYLWEAASSLTGCRNIWKSNFVECLNF